MDDDEPHECDKASPIDWAIAIVIILGVGSCVAKNLVVDLRNDAAKRAAAEQPK